MNFFIFSAIINAFVAGLLGFFVLLKNRRDFVNKLFFGLSISVLFWSVSYWQWMLSDNASSALFWARLLSIGALFIPVFYFHWILALTGLHIKRINLIKLAYLIAFGFLLFSFSDLFIKGVEQRFIFPFWPIPNILYHFYLIFIYFGLIIYSLFLLVKQYRIKNGAEKANIKYIIIAGLVGFGGGVTNFFVWYNIPIFPYGNILVSFGLITFAIASLKYRLFNIRVVVTELLTFAIWTALFIRLLLSETTQDWIINGGLLIIVILFGVFLIRSTLKEVQQREKLEELAKELAAANQKLIEMDKLKAGMYSFVSHQLRAPMGVIKGFIQLIYGGSYGAVPDKVKERLIDMKKSVDRMLSLINDFLDLRKIEEGKMEYQFNDINIVDLIKSVIEELRLLAEEKGLEFLFNIETSDVQKSKPISETPDVRSSQSIIMVRADEQRLRQVIFNLVENAIKYTKKGFVRVDLRVVTDDQQQENVLIKVSDSGLGIAPEVIPTLFNEFKQAQALKKIKGSGLGLYIAKQIIDAHRGEIWAESEGKEGKGSSFYIKLKKI